MSAGRIDEAMARIHAAFSRIEAARSASTSTNSDEATAGAGSSRVLALVDAHERLREEVADTIGEIDHLIEELES